jgi:hypothetical protein
MANLLHIAARVAGRRYADELAAPVAPVEPIAPVNEPVSGDKDIGKSVADMYSEVLGIKAKFDGSKYVEADGKLPSESMEAIKQNIDKMVKRLEVEGFKKEKDDHATVTMKGDDISILLNKVPSTGTLAKLF